MKNLISKQTEFNLLKLGLYQIVGGVVGIAISLWLILKSQLFSGPAIVLYTVILIFYVYSIFCGTLCVKAKENALVHSLINQMLQLIAFTIFGFTFSFAAGIYIRVGVEMANSIGFDFDLGISAFSFSLIDASDSFLIDINLIALCLIFWIDKLRMKVKEEIKFRQMSSIVSSIGS